MSESRMGFRFHAWRAAQEVSSQQSHDHRTKHAGPPQEAFTGGGRERRSGFPSSMFHTGEPTVINEGGWVRPSPLGWALPPDVPLEAASKDTYGGKSVDNDVKRTQVTSTEFGAKPGGAWGSGMPVLGKARSLETIDSREAARKFGGRFI